MILVNGFQPLTIITKRSILDVAVALDPSLTRINFSTIDLCLTSDLSLNMINTKKFVILNRVRFLSILLGRVISYFYHLLPL